MRSRRGVATAALLAAVGLAAPARAQRYAARASFTMSGAYSQSISDAPYPTAQTFAGPSISLSPSLIALVDTIRTENTLTYGFSLSIPFTRQLDLTGAPLQYSNHLSYAGHYALNPITAMTFGAGFTESPINSFVASQDPEAAPIQAAPSGVSYMISANANEGISRQISDKVSLAQSTAFAFGNPVDPTSIRARTYSVSNSLSLTRTFYSDNLGVTLSNQDNYFTASQTATGQVSPGTASFANTLSLNWTHPFRESLTGSLTAGATQTISPTAAIVTQVQPTATVTLAYSYNLATATFAYTHAAMPNLSVGGVSFNDTASLRFSLPIGKSGFSTTGSVGFTHSTPIAGSGSVAPLLASNVFVSDAQIKYLPPRLETLTVGLRGQLTRQLAAQDLTNSLTRYTISLNLTYSYPSATAAAVRPTFEPLFSAQPPGTSEIISTDRPFADPIVSPQPVEEPPPPAAPEP